MVSSAAVVILGLLALCSGQLIIPPRPLGFVYMNGSSDSPIHLDVHMGPLCPDSAGAFPVLLQVAQHYGPATLKLTLHMFPLPYHRQSYFTAIGAEVVRAQRDIAQTFNYISAIYDAIDSLGNAKTAELNANDVNKMLTQIAGASAGVNPVTFANGLADFTMETKARTAWKYSASRGVASTPTFFLNDVTVEADPGYTLSEWQQIIDPLLKQGDFRSTNGTCPSGEISCEYLPGKTQCCLKGENCIPNVGCRCFRGGKCSELNVVAFQTCPSGEISCEYLPGKFQCCLKGENCIPNVGCRCFRGGKC